MKQLPCRGISEGHGPESAAVVSGAGWVGDIRGVRRRHSMPAGSDAPPPSRRPEWGLGRPRTRPTLFDTRIRGERGRGG